MITKLDVSRALREMGTLLQLRGENQFKVRAYETGARAIEAIAEELGTLVDEQRLTDVPGIGEALAAKIAELYATGRLPQLEKLRAEMPRGILELSRVPDLGPKKIEALSKELGVGSIAELKAACEAGRVRGLRGFGEKTEQKILENLKRLSERSERVPLHEAMPVGEQLLAFVREHPSIARADLGGSLRRFRDTVADLDLVVGSDEPEAVMDHFVRFAHVEKVEARGPTKCTVRLFSGLSVDLRVVGVADYATALHHFTGSKAHHVRLRGIARDQGLTISEWGLAKIDGGEKLFVGSEADLYRTLGLSYVPPELREDEGEIEQARAGGDFGDLVEEADIRGMVHCHTTNSDGKNSVEEMARAAEALGMRYITITDHSPTASYAGGVTVERLKRQWDEIARAQERVSIKILRGTESDILETGILDYPDAILEQLDVVIASVHSRMKMDEDEMTRRLVRCMRLPIFKIWGHGLGRLVMRRDPFACRVEEVLDALAEGGGAVEVNGDPHRLDLEPRWQRAARERGLRFVISVDAHSTAALDYLRYGIGTARRGGVRRGEVLNTLDADAFAAAVRPRP